MWISFAHLALPTISVRNSIKPAPVWRRVAHNRAGFHVQSGIQRQRGVGVVFKSVPLALPGKTAELEPGDSGA